MGGPEQYLDCVILQVYYDGCIKQELLDSLSPSSSHTDLFEATEARSLLSTVEEAGVTEFFVSDLLKPAGDLQDRGLYST